MYVSCSVEKLYAHDTLLKSSDLSEQLHSPPYHGRKVGCDLQGVPSNARVLGAGHTVHTW